jgi:hypothetical protein
MWIRRRRFGSGFLFHGVNLDFFLFFPAEVTLWNCGSGRDEEPSGEIALRLIQIRLATHSFEKILPSCQDKIDASSKFFIGAQNEKENGVSVSQRMSRNVFIMESIV